MKDELPSWPRLMLMAVPVAVMVACAYIFTNHRETLGGGAVLVAALAVVSFVGFFITLYFFYLRPQYGSRAPLHLLLFLLGHGVLVLLMWRAGVFG
ncbi:MAG: hypothetical protein ACUVRX_10975 [Actinomycetota bacterium]